MSLALESKLKETVEYPATPDDTSSTPSILSPETGNSVCHVVVPAFGKSTLAGMDAITVDGGDCLTEGIDGAAGDSVFEFESEEDVFGIAVEFGVEVFSSGNVALLDGGSFNAESFAFDSTSGVVVEVFCDSSLGDLFCGEDASLGDDTGLRSCDGEAREEAAASDSVVAGSLSTLSRGVMCVV